MPGRQAGGGPKSSTSFAAGTRKPSASAVKPSHGTHPAMTLGGLKLPRTRFPARVERPIGEKGVRVKLTDLPKARLVHRPPAV